VFFSSVFYQSVILSVTLTTAHHIASVLYSIWSSWAW